ncbi:transferase hexapeptide (six repeat-containing protein) [Eubacterium ruminantium]|nr:transferase hexapeptide (six repeat-containing protein) [Eubacterium ruminantium]
MKSLLIVGAGNFPPEVEELARLNGYDDFAFVDDNPSARCQPVIGSLMFLPTYRKDYPDAIVAFGDNSNRLLQTKVLLNDGYNVPTLIHPTAYVSPDAEIAPGCIIRAKAVVSRFVKLGTATILNVGALIDHDVEIGEGSHILMGAVVRNMVKLPPMSRVESNQVVE